VNTEYEVLLLLDPDLEEDRQNEIVTRTRETIERGGGSWDRHDVWGRRKLAYEIDHKGEGTYHLLLFAAETEVLDEITRVLRITDGVLRHLAVRRIKGTAAPPPEIAPAEPESAPAEPESAPQEEESAAEETEPEAVPEPG
jgi:small subunit ribosomal protein S6